jgi:hypothetical protein
VRNPHCAVTTGRNDLAEGVDLVVEGVAAEVSDVAERRHVADAYESKYGLRVAAPEGTWFGLGDAIRGGNVLLYRITPAIAFGFGKGRLFSQTQWSFSSPSHDDAMSSQASDPGHSLDDASDPVA